MPLRFERLHALHSLDVLASIVKKNKRKSKRASAEYQFIRMYSRAFL